MEKKGTVKRRNPEVFPLDDQRVYDAYIAGRQSAALAVGVRVGLFDWLEQGARSEREIVAHFGYESRAVRALLSALFAMGLLVRRGDAYGLAEDASAYLVKGKPGWLGGLIDLEVDHFLSPVSLLQALEKGAPSVYGEKDPWEAHEADPALAKRFTDAMHSVSERAAAGFAEVVDFSRSRRLLDVGGGSGALSIAAAKRWPHLACVIWDLAPVCEIAREYARAAGLSERVTAKTGDMFREEFPTGHDAILFSQILHDWPLAKGVVLLAKAWHALPSSGTILVHEKLVDDDGHGPLANALVNLDMAVWTEGQQLTEAGLREMLGAAGFRDISRLATAGYWSVVIGRR